MSSNVVGSCVRTEDASFMEFCEKLPKVELHAHLNGSISRKTIAALIALKQAANSDWKCPDVDLSLTNSVSMNEVFRLFPLIQSITDTEEAVKKAASDVIADFAAESVHYLELRSTPREVAKTGLTKMGYLHAIHSAISEARASDVSITVNMIVSLNRSHSVEEAMEHVDIAIVARDTHRLPIVGVELSGDPWAGDARSFIPALRKATSNGLRTSIHISEVKGKKEEVTDILKMLPDRLGHGTFLLPEAGGRQEWVDIIVKNRIPLELCLTSNLKTETVNSYCSHHFEEWFNRRHHIAVCTDDKGLFDTTLSTEYAIAASTFGLSKNDIYRLSYDAIDYCWISDEQKDELRNTWNSWKLLNSELFL